METRKTNRKNNTNQTITWPTTNRHFSIKDLFALNPDMREITLRTKLNEAMAESIVTTIGTKKLELGRSIKILAMNPITQEVLNAAYADGVAKLEDLTKSLVTMTTKTATTPISTANNQSVAIPTTNDAPVTPAAPSTPTPVKNIVNA